MCPPLLFPAALPAQRWGKVTAYLYTSGMERAFAGNNSWKAVNTSFFEVLTLQNEV